MRLTTNKMFKRFYNHFSIENSLISVMLLIMALIALFCYFQHTKLNSFFVLELKATDFTSEIRLIESDEKKIPYYLELPGYFRVNNGDITKIEYDESNCYSKGIEILRNVSVNYSIQEGLPELYIFSKDYSEKKDPPLFGKLYNSVNIIEGEMDEVEKNQPNILDLTGSSATLKYEPRCLDSLGVSQDDILFNINGPGSFGDNHLEELAAGKMTINLQSGTLEMFGRSLPFPFDSSEKSLFQGGGEHIDIAQGSIVSTADNLDTDDRGWGGQAYFNGDTYWINASIDANNIRVFPPFTNSGYSDNVKVGLGGRILHDPNMQIYLAILAVLGTLIAFCNNIYFRNETQRQHLELLDQLKTLDTNNGQQIDPEHARSADLETDKQFTNDVVDDKRLEPETEIPETPIKPDKPIKPKKQVPRK